MTPAELLALAGAAGLALSADPRGLRIRGPAAARESFRDELAAAAPAILAWLRGMAMELAPAAPVPNLTPVDTRREIAAMYRRLQPLAASAPPDMAATVATLWPALATELIRGQARVEGEGAKVSRGTGNPEEFRRALGCWEETWRTALGRLANGCLSCGATSVVVAVVDDAGVRRCRRCFGGGT